VSRVSGCPPILGPPLSSGTEKKQKIVQINVRLIKLKNTGAQENW
jgi:hypothetical protein